MYVLQMCEIEEDEKWHGIHRKIGMQIRLQLWKNALLDLPS